jgi:CRP/FNR family cyclic AMP-dependent transcriptional regulator
VQTLEPILAEHPFFKNLDSKILQVITGCATNVVFKPGEFIFREEGDAQEFYLIRKGQVALEIYAPGRGPITVQTLHDGNILGWSWLVPPYQWHFDARAVEETRAIALNGRCLRTKCEECHELGYELMKRFAFVVTQRIEALTLQLLDIYGNHRS